MGNILDRAGKSGFSKTPANIVFDAEKKYSDVIAAVRLDASIKDILKDLRTSVPVSPNSNQDFMGAFYRLPGHQRSWCYAIEGDKSGKIFDSDVVVVKGTEPLSPDFENYFAWMASSPASEGPISVIEHFALVESKAPGALYLSEALVEAEIACEIQRKHVKHYGELAPLPVPLLVHKLDIAETNRCLELYRGELSKKAFNRIAPLVKDGLGIGIYYFPHAPIRAGWFADPEARDFVTDRKTDPIDKETTIENWIKYFVRMLYLGFMPATSLSRGTGACLDDKNATVDGGFCDIDSVMAFEDIPSDLFFMDSLAESLKLLEETQSKFLNLNQTGSLSVRWLLRFHNLKWLDKFIASEARPGLKMDERVRQILHPDSLGGSLKRIIPGIRHTRPYRFEK